MSKLELKLAKTKGKKGCNNLKAGLEMGVKIEIKAGVKMGLKPQLHTKIKNSEPEILHGWNKLSRFTRKQILEPTMATKYAKQGNPVNTPSG